MPGNEHPGYVYVVANDANKLVKIGWAIDPDRRCSNLQTGSPATLKVVRRYRGGRGMESWLHSYFAVQRKHGEWFSLGTQLRKIDLAVSEYERGATIASSAERARKEHEVWKRRSAAISAGIARRKAAGFPTGAAARGQAVL